jgi:hypothetical protein
MEWPLPELIGVLQKYILSKSGIQIISPGDCKQVSKYIEALTGKVISETTLKRFFGFAKQQYNFSRFTLNALSEFVGFSGWEDFRRNISQSGDLSAGQAMWEEYRQKALFTTRITESTLKNLCGVPFSTTISRSAIEADFDYFLSSDYQFFCLSSSAGMGKSVQMAHLAEKFFLKENAPYEKSIVWFLKSPILQKLEPYDFNFEESTGDQFKIGWKFSFLEHFKNHPAEVKGKLVLLLDGFDDHAIETTELDQIFQKIIDLLCYAQGVDWLKVVISLRSSTWHKLHQKVNGSEYLKKTWFSGVFYQKETRVNLTPLSISEVHKVLKAIHVETKSENRIVETPELYQLFNHPYYLQLYYQLLEKNSLTSLRGQALYCELVTSFAFHRIYQSAYSIEKCRLLQKLVRAADYGRSTRQVERRVLFEANDLYVLAYNDLINEGILQEINRDSAFHYQIEVQFMHQSLFTYFVAQELIDEEKSNPGGHLFERIVTEYEAGETRSELLRWIVLHAVMQRVDDLRQIIFHSWISVEEQCHLMTFIADLIEEDAQIISQDVQQEFIDESVMFMAMHLLEIERLDAEVGQTLQTFLSHAQTTQSKANLLIVDAILGIVQMDKAKLGKAIIQLKKLDKGIFTYYFPLHPVRLLECVYRYYAMEPIGKYFDRAMEAFIADPPGYLENDLPDASRLLSYQLGIFTSIFTRNPKQSIQFTETVQQLHPDLFSQYPGCGAAMYLLMREAFASLRMQKTGRAKKIAQQLKDFYQPFSIGKCYSHLAGLYDILQGEVAVAEHNLNDATKYFQEAYTIGRQSGFTMLQVYALLPLIRLYRSQKNFDGITGLLEETRKHVSRLDFPIEKLLLNRLMEEV